MTGTYKLEKKSVNNKALFAEIHKFVVEGIEESGVIWGDDLHRESFVEVVGFSLEEVQDNGFIDQWNVISDFRNNNVADMDNGIYVVEISYRQRNCLNTTRLIYTITDALIANIKDLLDFDLTP